MATDAVGASKQDASAARQVTLLVVDPDRVSQRFVEAAFGGRSEIVVESAKDGGGALEIARSSYIDLVISESDLPDMHGLDLRRRMVAGHRVRDIPFVFLTSDDRVESKAAALGNGIEDYVTKPCDKVELAARVERVLMRLRSNRVVRDRDTQVAGSMAILPLPDLVTALSMGRRTGVLFLWCEGMLGEVYFSEGMVPHVQCGTLSGIEGFCWLMEQPDGQFEFLAQPNIDVPQTVNCSPTALLLECARRIDTERASEPAAAKQAPIAAPPAQMPRLVPAPHATPALAQSIGQAITDGFSIGELHLFPDAELSDWTRTQHAPIRVHSLLITDFSSGVSSLIELASAPGERELLTALATGPKTLVLSFSLRHQRMLDIVLVDINAPGRVQKFLHRRPSFAIVAAPGGDPLSIGATALMQLDGLLGQLAPPIIVGVGRGGLRNSLASLTSVRLGTLQVRGMEGALGDSETNLRECMLRGLQVQPSSKPR
jgi:CheY-like chemotaxis protein